MAAQNITIESFAMYYGSSLKACIQYLVYVNLREQVCAYLPY